MKIPNRNHLGAAVVLLAVLSSHGIAYAHEGHDASPKPATAEAAPGAEAKVQIPATADGIWIAIDQKRVDLAKLIQSGALGEVHHVAFAIRDLVAALPARSTSLPAEQQGKIQGSVKFVATLADRLDASGDANDKAGVQDNFEKMTKLLDSLRANYPSKAGG